MTEKVSIYSIKSKIKTILKQKYDYEEKSIFKSLKFDDTFDWGKYAEILSKATEDKSIFNFEEGESEEDIEEKSFTQILNELVSMEEVRKAIDTDMDEAFSAEELEEYFKEINTLDGNDEDLSFKDISQFIKDNEIDMEQFGISDEEVQQVPSGGSVGGSGGPGGGSYYPTNADPTGDPQNTTGDDTGSSSFDETIFPKEDADLDVKSPDFNTKVAQYTDNLFDLGAMSYSKMAGSTSADGNFVNNKNDMTLMGNISQEDRQRLQNAATELQFFKDEYIQKIDELGFEDEAQKTAAFEYVTAIEAQLSAQEQVDAVKIQVDNLTNEITNLDATITSISDTITGLESSFVDVPQEQKDEDGKVTNKDEIRAAQNRNAQIKEEIAQLKKELEAQNNAKQELETQKTDLESQISETGSLGSLLVQANERVKETKTAAESFGENAEEAMINYLEAVKLYQEASSKYLEIKNEVMTKMNDEIKTAREEAKNEKIEQNKANVEKRKSEVDEQGNWAKKDDGASYMEDYKPDETTNTYLDLKELKDNNVPLEEAPEDLKELYGQYLQFRDGETESKDDDNLETIEKAFGSEDNFLKMLAIVKDETILDENGKEISYVDVLLNPENYKDLKETIEKFEADEANKDKTQEEIIAEFTPENATFGQKMIIELASCELKYENPEVLFALVEYAKDIQTDESGNLINGDTGEAFTQEELDGYISTVTDMTYTDLYETDITTDEGLLGVQEILGLDEYEYATSTGGLLTKEEYEDVYNIDLDATDEVEEEDEEDKDEEEDDEERS